jgi:uncharacterized membrane protein
MPWATFWPSREIVGALGTCASAMSPPFATRIAKSIVGGAAVVAIVALALYPVLVYFGLRYFGLMSVAWLLVAACALRLAASRMVGPQRAVGREIPLVCGAGIVLAAIGMARGSAQPMLYYPVLVNAVLLVVFALSLLRPPTIVERIARLRDPELSPEGVRYTRRVTLAWVVFFAVNGAIALYTANYTSLETWTLYNGIIAYIAMGVMFCAEFLFRLRARAKKDGQP